MTKNVPILKKKKVKSESGELQSDYSQMDPWKGLRVVFLEHILEQMKGKKEIGSSQYEFSKNISCLTNLTAFDNKTIRSVDK